MSIWESCLERLEGELTPQQFNTWIRPLQAIEDENNLKLLAPNRFVLDWINEKYLDKINSLLEKVLNGNNCVLSIEVGSNSAEIIKNKKEVRPEPIKSQKKYSNYLNSLFTFESFVEGKSNQLARAASIQTSENPGDSYNPLFIYGGVGLGKTHLMHSIGHAILAQKPGANIAYLHSERFVADMVRALQHNAINEFKRYYRSLDALLIDDIQFFAGKERSQEEFFHTLRGSIRLS